jgi:hypothetical protein
VILKTYHHWFTHHNLNLRPVPQEGVLKVGSLCGSLGLHKMSRGGSCSDLSCLIREDVLSIAGFITGKVMHRGVCCIRLFTSRGIV